MNKPEYQRYFLEIAYNGTRYSGWQIQPNANTVQQEIENALSLVLREKISVIGCGRTDAGVHASSFYLHFDTKINLGVWLIDRVNGLLQQDIAVYGIWRMVSDAHARFDAMRREYQYFISAKKNPFRRDTTYVRKDIAKFDFQRLNQAAKLLLEFKEFDTFCKAHADSKTTKCDIYESNWTAVEDGLVFDIAANRFLRGMVRLVVGMCINVGIEKISIEEVSYALKHRQILDRNWSVPAKGLFLSKVIYKKELFDNDAHIVY